MKQNIKTIGLIGHANFHNALMSSVRQKIGQKNGLPYVYCHIEDSFIRKEYDKSCETALCYAAAFRQMGVSAIAFTTPEFYNLASQVTEVSGLPVIHLGNIVGQKIKTSGLRRVGVLGLNVAVLKDSILEHAGKSSGAEIYVPDDRHIQYVNNVIDKITRGNNRKQSEEDCLFDAISSMHLDHQIQGVVLLRPELKPSFHEAAQKRFCYERVNDKNFQFIDGTELLVEAIVDYCYGNKEKMVFY